MCSTCGATLAPGVPPAPAPDEPVPDVAAPAPRARYGAARRVALVRGSLAFGIALLTALVLAALVPTEGLSPADTLRIGGLQFYAFNRVAIQVELPPVDLGAFEELAGEPTGIPFGAVQVSVSIALAMLLATGMVVWLLYRGGRAAAEAAGGRALEGVVMGAAVALPYAALALVFSFLSVLRIDVPPDVPVFADGQVRIGPSPAGAFLWPLVLGLAAGALGGFSAVRHGLRSDRAGRALAALDGGGRMLAWAIAVSLVGFFVVLAANPDVVRGLLRAVADAGPRGGAAIMVYWIILVTPGVVAWGLFVGMGTSVVVGDYLGANTFTLLSLARWPDPDPALLERLDPFAAVGAPQLPFAYGLAPPEWFTFILAPLAGVLLGGRWAARRAGAVTRGQGGAAGALAGIPFALGCLALSVLAGIAFRAEIGIPFFPRALGRVGPHLFLGTAVALAWGVLGGALGGALLGRGRPEGKDNREEGPTAPPGPASY